MKAHPSSPCSWYLLSAPRTICTYTIWGSSGPNKSHVLITFEGVMTSGLQPIFIWFQSEGQRAGYASHTLRLSSPSTTCHSVRAGTTASVTQIHQNRFTFRGLLSLYFNNTSKKQQRPGNTCPPDVTVFILREFMLFSWCFLLFWSLRFNDNSALLFYVHS